MMRAPCVLQEDIKLQCAQTYVIQPQTVDYPKMKLWGQSQLSLNNIHAYAEVSIQDEIFVVVTYEAPVRTEKRYQKIKEELKNIGCKHALKIYPLTRRLQRKFGWGDVKKDVCTVIKKTHKAFFGKESENEWTEVKTLWPQAASVLEYPNITVELLLNHYNAPAETILPDCFHKFPAYEMTISERILQNAAGHCSNDFLHTGPFHACLTCKKSLCHSCCVKARLEEESIQELCDLRTWLSNEAPEIQYPHTKFVQHPRNPLPFFVLDSTKIHDDEKVEWIRQEIGDHADLVDFARYFRVLFDESIKNEYHQKTKCYELFCRYSNEARKPKRIKLANIPIEDKGPFERLWDPSASNFCKKCGQTCLDSLCQKCVPRTPLILDEQGKAFKPFEITKDIDELSKQLNKIKAEMNQLITGSLKRERRPEFMMPLV